MKKKQDMLRDPIWQFISTIVGVLAIFIAFLTLPSSVQGTAFIGILITCIILLIMLLRSIGALGLIIILFYFISVIWNGILCGGTYYNVPFFSENLGLIVPGVIYARTNLGLDFLYMEYVLWVSTFLLAFYYFARKRSYILIINIIVCFVFIMFLSNSSLYTPNFVYMRVFFLDLSWPKTILGAFILLFGTCNSILCPFLMLIESSRKRK